jgi:hypothetical protein
MVYTLESNALQVASFMNKGVALSRGPILNTLESKVRTRDDGAIDRRFSMGRRNSFDCTFDLESEGRSNRCHGGKIGIKATMREKDRRE